MQFSACREAADECRDWARDRYQTRALVCSLTAAGADCGPEHLLAAGTFDLSAPRRVEPGRALLLKVKGPEEGSRLTFLARVTSADRRADGSWLVRCRFAGTPRRPEESAAPPAPRHGLPGVGPELALAGEARGTIS